MTYLADMQVVVERKVQAVLVVRVLKLMVSWYLWYCGIKGNMHHEYDVTRKDASNVVDMAATINFSKFFTKSKEAAKRHFCHLPFPLHQAHFSSSLH